MSDVISLAAIVASFGVLVGVVRFCAWRVLDGESDLRGASDLAAGEPRGRPIRADRLPR
jgi:hypothetical protein